MAIIAGTSAEKKIEWPSMIGSRETLFWRGYEAVVSKYLQKNRTRMFTKVLVLSLGLQAGGLVFTSNVQLRSRPRRETTLEAGRIALVGAGPGDPELLTVAALRYIANPDALVVADRLVSREILELVSGELRIAAKRPGCAEEAQQQIYDWVVEGVLANRTVVRLKIGDPFVFGRGAEEILEFRETLGVEAVVVPGISASLAAPLAAGVPVTHRGAAHQAILTTGYGREGSEPELPPWAPHQTYVLLMAVGRLAQLTETLIETKDFPESCPALIVERATCPDQRVLLADLATIAELAKEHAIKAPSTIVFGATVRALYPDHPHGLVEPRNFHTDHQLNLNDHNDLLSVINELPASRPFRSSFTIKEPRRSLPEVISINLESAIYSPPLPLPQHDFICESGRNSTTVSAS